MSTFSPTIFSFFFPIRSRQHLHPQSYSFLESHPHPHSYSHSHLIRSHPSFSHKSLIHIITYHLYSYSQNYHSYLLCMIVPRLLLTRLPTILIHILTHIHHHSYPDSRESHTTSLLTNIPNQFLQCSHSSIFRKPTKPPRTTTVLSFIKRGVPLPKAL